MEFDQEKNLDEANKIIKVQAYHLNKNIENNNLRQSLKESAVMLAELKTSNLNPRNYYSIFTVIVDELHFLEQYFKEEVRRGRRIKHLYESVQQAQSIIPRLYLMITAGRVYIESKEVSPCKLIFELLSAVKGVQNPTRGLFLRYYLLKMMKDNLPDTTEDLNVSLKFILQNLEDMNRLWIRLSTGCSGNEKLIREKERNELKILVGENIIRISNLDSLSVTKYKNEVLPRILSILLETKDTLSQQYILECVIHAFSENFNIACMNIILETLTKVVPTVDIKSIFINLMEKLSKFIKNEENRKDDEDKDNQEGEGELKLKEEVEKIFGLLKENIDKLVEDGIKNKGDELKIIELQVAFMNFTLNCCPQEQKIETVNHITNSVLNKILKVSTTTKLSKDTIKQILKILTLPLENKISVFKIPLFSDIMGYLDYNSRSTLSLDLLSNLAQVSQRKVFISSEDDISNDNIDEDNILNTIEKIESLLSYIRPLTENTSESNDIDKLQFNYEQLAVSKLVFSIRDKNPVKYFNMIKIVQNVFVKGGEDRVKVTIPTLINLYLTLISNCYLAHYTKQNEEMKKDKVAYQLRYLEEVDVSVFGSDNELIEFSKKLYDEILYLINKVLIPVEYGLSFQLLLNVLFNLNTCIKLDLKDLAKQLCQQLIDSIKDLKNEQSEKKLNLFILFSSSLLSIKCLDIDFYKQIVETLSSIAGQFVKRYEQSTAMLNVSNLYFHDFYNKDEESCKESLESAVEFADYAMSTNTQACLNLYILIINKYIFYVQKGASFLTSKKINKTIEKVNNYIKSIKAENQELENLNEIEAFFRSTLEFITNKKSSTDIKIFSELNSTIN